MGVVLLAVQGGTAELIVEAMGRIDDSQNDGI
jgi:hypothetical protein